MMREQGRIHGESQMDLHTHTHFSDGQYAPATVVARAAAAGVTHLAVTDHDTVGGIAEARAAARASGLWFTGGIELSTSDGDRQHLLGYGISETDCHLLERCELLAARRLSRGKAIAALLAEQGLPISFAEVQTMAKGQVGRPHFAKLLVQKGYVSSVREAFRQFLSGPAIRALPDAKPTAAEVITWVHEAGGVAVLAHPVTLGLDDAAFQRRLDALCAQGLDGLETFYGQHTPAQITFYADCARRRGLLQTGGSDFHGEAVKPDNLLGVPAVAEVVTQQRLGFQAPDAASSVSQ